MKTNETNQKKDALYYGRKYSAKYPSLRPFFLIIKKIFYSNPTFSGWGMITMHALPWEDEFDWKEFIKTNNEIKRKFNFKGIPEINSKSMEELLWRNWIVSYSMRHSIKFAKNNENNFVECGVSIGLSAYFLLKEISNQNLNDFSMHLYDSWGSMRKENLLEYELSSEGRYSTLDINSTKKNLAEFLDHCIFHQGYIPESFKTEPMSPNSISYLHIDLNSSKSTLAALQFFFPKIVEGGIILFDDYGDRAFIDTKNTIDEFFHNKPGILLKLPTGQAIYYHTNSK